jgi:predicted DNA binding protein
MSVITEFRIPSSDFELGQILTVEGMSSIELERLVPLGERMVPLFWIYDSTKEPFIETVEEHPAVSEAAEIDVFDDRVLFTLEWDASDDSVLGGLETYGGQLLGAVGTSEAWEFEVRFSDHHALTEFTTHCANEGISIELNRIYNPTDPDAGPWYGLTDPQREAILLATESGYYDIPRGCTTKELAAELGISDQAVTERLRRAIATIVSHALVPTHSA